MSSQIDVYNQEIINFLRTVTIKFEPFAYQMGSTYMQANGLTDPHAEWNPYYKNICGEYSDTDTKMYVYDPETKEEVLFSKELLQTHPLIASTYRIPNTEYFTLEEKYPQNKGLIRAIAYPISVSMQEAIAAPNLTLLGYDETLLESQERESIINCLKNFLDELRTRWWLDEFVYEDLYPITFWCLLWQYLPNLLLTQRFKNIRTPYVHSFHIWEYLKSKGFGDYRDVLTLNQSMWLYRNVNYIHKNRGKNSNLRILAENLLPEVAVSLLYKDMYQDTTYMLDNVRSTPEFLSINLNSGEVVKSESMEALNTELYKLGLEDRQDADYVAEVTAKLGTQPHNILPTKFLEFKREPLDTRNEKFMINFFLDTLMYRAHENKLPFNISFLDPLGTEGATSRYEISIKDAILIWHYACRKYLGDTLNKIPTKWKLHHPFMLAFPGDENLTQEISVGQNCYLVKTLINLPELKSKIEWDSTVYGKQKYFLDNLIHQYYVAIKIKECMEQSSYLPYHLAMMQYLSEVTVQDTIEFDFGYETFASWINDSSVAPFMQAYEDLDVKTHRTEFENLAVAAFDALFPISTGEWSEYLGNAVKMESIYAAVRDLFIKLGSYNVTYLETDRSKHEYLTLRELDFVSEAGYQAYYDNIWKIIDDSYLKSYVTYKPIESYVSADVVVTSNMDAELNVEASNLQIDNMPIAHTTEQRRLQYMEDTLSAKPHEVVYYYNSSLSIDTGFVERN